MKNPNKVDVSKLHRRIRQALFACDIIYFHHGCELVLFHSYDGKHMEGSLHFKNRAFDCGYPDKDPAETIEAVEMFLGSEYDVVQELDHLHVEWDPK